MKLGELKSFNVKRGMVITAKAESKKRNLPQKKEKINDRYQPLYESVAEERVIELTDNSYLVVSASRIEGEEDVYVDVRRYVKNGNIKCPTTKGIRIHIEFLQDLIEALQELDNNLNELGL